MPEDKSVPPSAFSEQLQAVIERWSQMLPLHLRERFRDEFGEFGDAHDRTMNILEGIWKRRDRSLSLDDATGLARRRPFQEHLARVPLGIILHGLLDILGKRGDPLVRVEALDETVDGPLDAAVAVVRE